MCCPTVTDINRRVLYINQHRQTQGTLGVAMKKFLLGSVGLVAMLAGPAAMAADMPIKAPPPPPVAYYDWTGAYIGFNAGSTGPTSIRLSPIRAARRHRTGKWE